MTWFHKPRLHKEKKFMEISIEGEAQNLRNNEAAILEKILHITDGGGQRTNNDAGSGLIMQKVPPGLRLDKKSQQEYDPQVVSLGPYHHGKKELQSAEDFKLNSLQMFVDGSGKDASYFYQEVLQRVNYARGCYTQDSTQEYDDQRFAQMMLLDACFIINRIAPPTNYFMACYHFGDLASVIILRDMFLLENQIPFWMVKFLICLRYGKEQGKEMLNKLLYSTMFGENKTSGLANRDDEKQPLHLLDAFWQVLVSEEKPAATQNSSYTNNNVCSGSGSLKNMPKFSCLPQCISNSWRRSRDDKENNSKKHIHCFRSATDLKAKGIHFRPSSTDSLKGIKFKSRYFYALLEVPSVFVSIHTKVFFLNMIAYELCPRRSTHRAVTAYIEFMKLLIDNPEDVKELREKRILLTTLGSDEEVFKVFKEINTYGLDKVCIFQDVKEEIEAHYNSKAKTWLAELIYTYFRNPWTAIALFAASFLLLLTFLQTYYTIRPSKSHH